MATQFSVNDNIPWKTRFFTIWGGQAISIIGSQLVQFALIWYLTVQTGSATVLATALMTMGPFYAMIQTIVEPDMQARIFSLLNSVGAAMVPIGLLVAGPVADRFSIQVWFLFGGLLCILMAICGLFIPAVMQIESRDTTMPGDVSQSLA
jgi:MFS family permease